MKSVLISIRPQWCEKIASGQKTIEVRKTAPKEMPFKAYIYCTKAKSQWRYSDYEGAYENSKGEIVYAQQRVIGEFICDKVERFDVPYPAWDKGYLKDILDKSCLTYNDLHSYIGSGNSGYGWHISDLKIYDKPKELSEFRKPFIDYVSPKGSKMVNPKIGISEYVTCPPQSWIFVEEK